MAREEQDDLSAMMSNFQISLNAFVGASEQAIAHLSPKKKTFKSKNFIDAFRELPVEIRHIVYHHLFENAYLDVPWIDIASNVDGRMKLTRLSSDAIMRRVDFHKAALLIAVEWCKEEACSILASQTTIEFSGLTSWNSEHINILNAIDPAFLKHVKKIEMPTINFIRCDRDSLTSLEQVCLTHHIQDDHEDFEVGAFCAALEHEVLCGDDGDNYGGIPSAQFALEEYRKDACDFNWKSKQLVHLAEEQGWKLRLVARWYPLRSFHARAWYEVAFTAGDLKALRGEVVIRTSSGEVRGPADAETFLKLGLINDNCYICAL